MFAFAFAAGDFVDADDELCPKVLDDGIDASSAHRTGGSSSLDSSCAIKTACDVPGLAVYKRSVSSGRNAYNAERRAVNGVGDSFFAVRRGAMKEIGLITLRRRRCDDWRIDRRRRRRMRTDADEVDDDVVVRGLAIEPF